MSEKTIRVLHIVPPGSDTFSGVDAYLSSYYSHMNHEKVHFDFAYCRSNTMRFHIDEGVFSGSTFTNLNVLKGTRNSYRNWIYLIKAVREQIEHNHYDYVEVHSASPMIQAACGIAMRPFMKITKIAHAHALQEPTNNKLKTMVSKLCMEYVKKEYDYVFSCSYAAGEVYGKDLLESERFVLVNNAIDISKFTFKKDIRDRVRKEHNVEDNCIIIGHVARLSEEKNQVFLIDVFNELLKREKNCVLWIVGEGPSRKNIETKIIDLGLSKKVIMLGQRSDVPDLLQAMDVFVITSKQEGLCISAIESQAAGLPTFVSTGVPEECGITSCFIRVSLNSSAEEWAKTIIKGIDKNRENTSIILCKSGYEIQTSAKALEQFYCSHCIN